MMIIWHSSTSPPHFSRDSDASFDELRKLYAENDRLHVPATVFNAALNRPELL